MNHLTEYGIRKGRTSLIYNVIREMALDFCFYKQNTKNINHSHSNEVFDVEDDILHDMVIKTTNNIPNMIPKLKKISDKKTNKILFSNFTITAHGLAEQKRKQQRDSYIMNIGLSLMI